MTKPKSPPSETAPYDGAPGCADRLRAKRAQLLADATKKCDCGRNKPADQWHKNDCPLHVKVGEAFTPGAECDYGFEV